MTQENASFVRRAVDLVLHPSPGQPLGSSFALRAVVGSVFVASGAIKFLFQNQGPGRFAKIGFPAPEQLAYFVGTVEIVAGSLLIIGLFARVACIPLMIDMLVAIISTKLPLLFGAGPEPVAAPPKLGFWAFAYQARLDLTMLVACGTIAAIGAGLWSVDALLSRRRAEARLLARVHAES